jgi:hypothetical protein
MLIKGIALWYWIPFVAMVGVLLFLVNADYSIAVERHYTLYWPDVDSRTSSACIRFFERGKRLKISDVSGYAKLRGYVVGRTGTRMFLADPQGEVQSHEDYESWMRACRRVDSTFDGSLRAPSRLDNPFFAKAFLLLSLLFALWLCIGVLLLRRSRKRARAKQPAKGGCE